MSERNTDSVKINIAGRVFVLLLILLISVVYIYFLGQNTFRTLGWAVFLFPAIWIILIMTLKIKFYYERILLFVLSLIGFIIMNHITYALIKNDMMFNFITMYLFYLSAGLILVPFIALLDNPILKSSKLPEKNKTVFKNFRFALSSAILGAFYVSGPLVIVIAKAYLVPLLIFIPFIIAFSVWIIFLMRLSDKEIAYLFEAIEIRGEKRNKQKLYIVCILFILISLLSVLLETYRGLWLHGLAYAVTLSVIAINLTFVYRQMFRSEKSEMELPQRFLTYLISPGILFIVSFSYFIIVIIIGCILDLGINNQFFDIR